VFILPDLRGHGASPPLGEARSTGALADDIFSTLRADNLDGPYTLVGHSFGGRVALAAAGQEPGALAEVVLLDISPGPVKISESRGVLDILLRAPAEAESRHVMRDFLLGEGLSAPLTDWVLMNVKTQASGEVGWRFDRDALLSLHAWFTKEDLWPIVEQTEVPLHLIYGARSHYVGADDVARFEATGGRVDVLKDAGHFVHVDAKDALVRALTE
jgi:pimeloyl-ACP methyl ester carboxylesterase